jgi:hypothetical protein
MLGVEFKKNEKAVFQENVNGFSIVIEIGLSSFKVICQGIVPPPYDV